MHKDILSYTVRPSTTPEDFALPYMTSSMVEAIQTCPKWGILRNVQNRSFTTGYRQMALEAGSLMHEVFSIFNLFQVAYFQKLPAHAIYAGKQLFTSDRFAAIEFETIIAEVIDPLRALEKLAYRVIGTSDYYDDPNDKKRTLSNLELCAVELARYYLGTHAAFNIYISDETDPTKEIGIEKSLDVIFAVQLSDNTCQTLRFIGLMDALYQNKKTGKTVLGEYKTASSLNEAWQEAFKTRHQITAYQGALEGYFPDHSFETIVTGSCLPVPRSTVPIMHFSVPRDRQNVIEFLRSALFATTLVNDYPDYHVVNAPMFTHSCNRYFRPCSLLDFCIADKDDQHIMWEQMEISSERSPSEMKALLRQGE